MLYKNSTIRKRTLPALWVISVLLPIAFFLVVGLIFPFSQTSDTSIVKAATGIGYFEGCPGQGTGIVCRKDTQSPGPCTGPGSGENCCACSSVRYNRWDYKSDDSLETACPLTPADGCRPKGGLAVCSSLNTGSDCLCTESTSSDDRCGGSGPPAVTACTDMTLPTQGCTCAGSGPPAANPDGCICNLTDTSKNPADPTKCVCPSDKPGTPPTCGGSTGNPYTLSKNITTAPAPLPSGTPGTVTFTLTASTTETTPVSVYIQDDLLAWVPSTGTFTFKSCVDQAGAACEVSGTVYKTPKKEIVAGTTLSMTITLEGSAPAAAISNTGQLLKEDGTPLVSSGTATLNSDGTVTGGGTGTGGVDTEKGTFSKNCEHKDGITTCKLVATSKDAEIKGLTITDILPSEVTFESGSCNAYLIQGRFSPQLLGACSNPAANTIAYGPFDLAANSTLSVEFTVVQVKYDSGKDSTTNTAMFKDSEGEIGSDSDDIPLSKVEAKKFAVQVVLPPTMGNKIINDKIGFIVYAKNMDMANTIFSISDQLAPYYSVDGCLTALLDASASEATLAALVNTGAFPPGVTIFECPSGNNKNVTSPDMLVPEGKMLVLAFKTTIDMRYITPEEKKPIVELNKDPNATKIIFPANTASIMVGSSLEPITVFSEKLEKDGSICPFLFLTGDLSGEITCDANWGGGNKRKCTEAFPSGWGNWEMPPLFDTAPATLQLRKKSSDKAFISAVAGTGVNTFLRCTDDTCKYKFDFSDANLADIEALIDDKGLANTDNIHFYIDRAGTDMNEEILDDWGSSNIDFCRSGNFINFKVNWNWFEIDIEVTGSQIAYSPPPSLLMSYAFAGPLDSKSIADAVVTISNGTKNYGPLKTDYLGRISMYLERSSSPYIITIAKNGYQTITGTISNEFQQAEILRANFETKEGGGEEDQTDKIVMVYPKKEPEGASPTPSATPDIRKVDTLYGVSLDVTSVALGKYAGFLLTWLYSMAAGIALLNLIVNGILLASAGGKTEQITESKKKITYTLIALALIFSSWLLTSFIGGTNVTTWLL